MSDKLSEYDTDVWYFDDSTTNQNHPYDLAQFRSSGISNADIVCVVVTEYTSASVGVATEVAQAKKYRIPIIPIVVSSTEDIPSSLTHLNYAHLRQSQIDEDASEMISTIEHLVQESRAKDIESQDSVLPSRSPARVFIAYSRKQRLIAHSISTLLSQNKIPHFWDAKIRAGATWRQTIQRALDDTTHVVVIWTSDAAQSDEVEREVSYALSEHKVIIPILSKEIPRLPYHLHGLHYIVLEDNVTKIEEPLLKAIAQFPADEDIWQ